MVVLSSFSFPESPIKHEQENTRVFMDKQDFGLGTLYISESTVSWKGQGALGFAVPYTHITLHAVCKDPLVCPDECIYIMTDTHVQMPGSNPVNIEPASAEDDSDNSSEADITELLLIPEDSTVINPIYLKMVECQALNPDPDDMVDEEDDDNMYQDAEDEGIYDIGGGGDAADMENITNRLSNNTIQVVYDYNNGSAQLDDEQFEDAD